MMNLSLGKYKFWFYSVVIFVGLPLLLWAVPELILSVGRLPAIAQIIVIGLTLAFIAVLSLTLTTRIVNFARDNYVKSNNKTEMLIRERDKSQRDGWVKHLVLEGEAERNAHIRIYEKGAGNFGFNLSIVPESVLRDGTLQEELKVAKRTVVFKPEQTPGIDLTAIPEIVDTLGGEAMLFRYPSVKSNQRTGDANYNQGRFIQQPMISNYLKGVHTSANHGFLDYGGSGMSNGRKGPFLWGPPTERNFFWYVSDIRSRDDTGDDEELELDITPIPETVEVGANGGGSLVDLGSLPEELIPIIKKRGLRAVRKISAEALEDLKRPIKSQMWDAEADWFHLAARQDAVVFLIHNMEAEWDNINIRGAMDVVESACLTGYHPLGDTAAGMMFDEPGKTAPGPYAVTIPYMEITDADSAQIFAERIMAGDLDIDIPFSSFDKSIPIGARNPMLFITGNWLAGQPFINQIRKIGPLVVAHWNDSPISAYAVLALALSPKELRESGMNLPPEAFKDV